MRRLTHIITGLDTGGAEVMLLNLLRHTDPNVVCSTVISLTGAGTMGEQIRELGIEVIELHMSATTPDPSGLTRLGQRLRRDRPHVVQTWLYHADLLGGITAKLVADIPVVWGLHTTELNPMVSKSRTRLIAWTCARLSNLVPTHIVCCSDAAYRHHRQQGYDDSRMSVIANGVDIDVFKPEPDAPQALRRELGLDPDTKLVGLAARFDPVKNHRAFIEAAGLMGRGGSNNKIHFVLCGAGVTSDNPQLAAWIAATGAQQCVHLLGERRDMPRLLSGLDLLTLTSTSEAAPIVLTEAMSCGIRCVAPDVGDCAAIIGDTGEVVDSTRPEDLVRAWQRLLTAAPSDRQQQKAAARQRIAERHSVARAAAEYFELYDRLARAHCR